MSFGSYSCPVGRKEYRCEWCYAPIPKGELHYHYAGIWEGEWQNWRMHTECYEVAEQEDLQDGFIGGEGEVPKRLLAGEGGA